MLCTFLKRMGTVMIFVFFVLVVVAKAGVTLKADRPSLRVQVSDKAVLKCCYTTDGKIMDLVWIMRLHLQDNSRDLQVVNISDRVTSGWDKRQCGLLTIKSVQLEDSALYQCLLDDGSKKLFTHGTYLQVYTPIKKMINVHESTKNKILTVEGVLLLLCVLLPSASLLCKSKKLNEIEKKRIKREEENIYQGLNLDDCSNAYDQIERMQAQDPYEDVENMIEEEEEIELEKP